MNFDITTQAPSSVQLADEAKSIESEIMRLKPRMHAGLILVAALFSVMMAFSPDLDVGAKREGFREVSLFLILLMGVILGFYQPLKDEQNGPPGIVFVFALMLFLPLTYAFSGGSILTLSCFAGIYGSFGYLFERSHEKIYILKKALVELDLIEPKSCSDVLEFCQTHPQIADYQRQVAGQERFLVQGEVLAMVRFKNSAKASAEAAKNAEACNLLKAPLSFG